MCYIAVRDSLELWVNIEETRLLQTFATLKQKVAYFLSLFDYMI